MISAIDARERLGLTQEALAALCGTTQAAIAGYEAGRRTPTGPAAMLYHAVNASLTTASIQVDLGRGRILELPMHRWQPAIAIDADITLPTRIDWSPRAKPTWNLGDLAVRESFYALVLDEGELLDICIYLHPAELVRMGGAIPVSRAARRPVLDLISRLRHEVGAVA
jgi:transcriptional regulator with XRE-family HTH domain